MPLPDVRQLLDQLDRSHHADRVRTMALIGRDNSGDPALTTLQYELQKLLASSMNAGANSANTAANAASVGAGGQLTTPIALRSAITMVAAIPILFVYPFLQKHFVSGLMIGSVKG